MGNISAFEVLIFSYIRMLKEVDMTTRNHGRGPADALSGRDNAGDELSVWEQFEDSLAAHLATMTDPAEEDHLRLELADPDPDGTAGCPPYAQFTGFAEGRMVRAELSGNAYLLPQYQLGAAGRALLEGMGWAGNVVDGGIEDRNWSLDRPAADAAEIAGRVTWALRSLFGIAHPHLLTYDAWGPAAEGVAALGLCASDDVPTDGPAPAGRLAPTSALAVEPADRAALLELVADVLHARSEAPATIDDDGDFVLHHLGQPLWVRVREDRPAVEILARVAHGVRSRRATAVEIGLLNRDNLWVRWTLQGRSVWQSIILPGTPFVPSHLDVMLTIFLKAMTSTRDDLAYRTHAKVA